MRWGACLAATAFVGCNSVQRPDNGILGGLPPVPTFVPAPPPTTLPAPPEARLPEDARKDGDKKDEPKKEGGPAIPPGVPLTLDRVLESVNTHFPLLLATQQERPIADGQVLAAEGQFDTVIRSRLSQNAGTFPVGRFDFGVDQPTAVRGINLFSGYRLGDGAFPGYNGGQETADGGELRAGIAVPLLRDAAIDRRRATARQAAILRSLAEPQVQRARIDFFLAAARAYWTWVAAAEQVVIARDLLRIATVRQRGLDEQVNAGAQQEFNAIDNRRLVADREGVLAAAELTYQRAALELSQYVRDADGDLVVPPVDCAPLFLTERTDDVPAAAQLPDLVQTAGQLRPELQRLAFQKEQQAVEIKLAENQTLPGLSLTLAGSQDIGRGKQATGSSALERSALEGGVQFDVPLQRRDPQGRLLTARGRMSQLVFQEQFARDRIQIEIQDALANLDRTRVRIQKAIEEQKVAERILDLERTRQREGQTDLLILNIRELTAAQARVRVVESVADFRRARAALRAALGQDAQR
jgi:outer membrane protein TolC